MAKSIKTNYIYSVAYQVLSIIVPLFTIPYLSRVFGAEGVGVYSYTTSIAQYFLLFAMLGLNNYGVRAVAMVRDNNENLNRTFSEIWAMQLIIAIFFILLYLGFILIWGTQYTLYLIILSLSVISALFDVNWYFFGIENFKITVIRNSVIKVFTLVFIFTLIKTPDDLWLYILLHAGSILISSIILWPSIMKDVNIVKPSVKGVIRHFKPNTVMFIPVIAISVYKYMDKIMLGANSMKEAGYFENVEKILTVVLGLVTAFGTVMLPRISNMLANNQSEEANRYLAKSMEFIMFLSAGITGGLFLISDIFVPIYFGEGFYSCINVMKALSLTAVITSWATVIRTQHLIPQKKDNVYVFSVIAGACINFSGNIFLIPKYGAMGAVYSTIMAEIAVALVQTLGSDKNLPYKIMLKDCCVYCFIAVIMVLAGNLIKKTLINNNIIGLITLIVFSGLLYLILTIIYKKIKDGYITFKI